MISRIISLYERQEKQVAKLNYLYNYPLLVSIMVQKLFYCLFTEVTITYSGQKSSQSSHIWKNLCYVQSWTLFPREVVKFNNYNMRLLKRVYFFKGFYCFVWNLRLIAFIQMFWYITEAEQISTLYTKRENPSFNNYCKAF